MRFDRIARILRILNALQSGEQCQATHLAQLFNISRRTLFRDLKVLRSIGVTYQYDPKSACYIVDQDCFQQPLHLTANEWNALSLTVKNIDRPIASPFPTLARLASHKIASTLPKRTKHSSQKLLQNISAKPFPRTNPTFLRPIFRLLQKAIAAKTRLIVTYHSKADGTTTKTLFDPYHLFYADYTWHIIGKSSSHKGISAIKLTRIAHMQPLQKCFILEKDFDIHEYLGRSWSVKPAPTLYNVKLKILPPIARDLATIQWHATQTATHYDDGSCTMEFRVHGLDEITSWILTYADHIRVLAPRLLATKLAQTAQNLLTNLTKAHPHL